MFLNRCREAVPEISGRQALGMRQPERDASETPAARRPEARVLSGQARLESGDREPATVLLRSFMGLVRGPCEGLGGCVRCDHYFAV